MRDANRQTRKHHTYTKRTFTTYIQTYIYVHTYTCIHTYIHTYIHTFTYTHIYIHTNIHTRIHTVYILCSVRAQRRTASERSPTCTGSMRNNSKGTSEAQASTKGRSPSTRVATSCGESDRVKSYVKSLRFVGSSSLRSGEDSGSRADTR